MTDGVSLSEMIGGSPEVPQRPLQGQEGKHKYGKWVRKHWGWGESEEEPPHPPLSLSFIEIKGGSYRVPLDCCVGRVNTVLLIS